MISAVILLISLFIGFVFICVALLLGASALLIRFAKLAFIALVAYGFAFNVPLCSQSLANFLIYFAIVAVVVLALSCLRLVGFAISFAATAFMTQFALFMINALMIYMPMSFFASESTMESVSTVVMSLGAAVAFCMAMGAAFMHLESFPTTGALPIVQSLLAAPLYSIASYFVVGMIPLQGGAQFSEHTLYIIAGVVGVVALVINMVAARCTSDI